MFCAKNSNIKAAAKIFILNRFFKKKNFLKFPKKKIFFFFFFIFFFQIFFIFILKKLFLKITLIASHSFIIIAGLKATNTDTITIFYPVPS